MRRPRPSLPVFGTESPPVATITASATIGGSPRRARRASRRAAGARPVTVVSVHDTDASPRRVARAGRRARRARGSRPGRASRDSGSSTSGMPSSRSKNAICSASGHERRILRRVFGEESVTKRDSSTRAGSTLQRPPPLMRILRPPSRVRSRSRVSAPARAAKMAAIVPAAPAPITTTRRVTGWGETGRGRARAACGMVAWKPAARHARGPFAPRRAPSYLASCVGAWDSAAGRWCGRCCSSRCRRWRRTPMPASSANPPPRRGRMWSRGPTPRAGPRIPPNARSASSSREPRRRLPTMPAVP